MRKVLLATTALVAMSVTAAQADITIGGNIAFEMEDGGAGTTYTSDGEIAIKSSTTTDSGLTVGAVFAQHTTSTVAIAAGNDTANPSTADSYISIGGDFGTIIMGDHANALDRMDGVLPQNMDLESVGDSGVTSVIGGQITGISFMAPTISGVSVYGATNAEGEENGMGVNYKNGPVTVMYQTGQDGSSEESALGASFTMSGLTLAAGSVEAVVAGTKSKYRSMGVKYTMGDITLVSTSQKKVGGASYTNIGAKYAVAPGLSVAIESGSQGSETATWAQVNVAF